MEIQVDVTQEDFDNESGHDVIAHAIYRTGQFRSVRVFQYYIYVTDKDYVNHEFETSLAIQDFINTFDSSKAVEPFSFALELSNDSVV